MTFVPSDPLLSFPRLRASHFFFFLFLRPAWPWVGPTTSAYTVGGLSIYPLQRQYDVGEEGRALEAREKYLVVVCGFLRRWANPPPICSSAWRVRAMLVTQPAVLRA
jgi:hypothetical protein